MNTRNQHAQNCAPSQGDDIASRDAKSQIDPRMRYFHELEHHQQVEAVKRMAAQGMSDVAIAMACAWSVEYVHHVLSERTERRA